MAESNKPTMRGVFINGVLNENPTFRLVLGTCPTLAVTTSAINGIGMGLAATFVLVCSNIVVSCVRKLIPDKARIPSFIVIIATFVTIVQMVMQAFLPSLYDALGLFIPLIVVNCIILARAEAFASKNGIAASALDGIFQGIGYTLVLIVMCVIREFLGSGTFGGGLLGPEGSGIRILPEGTAATFLVLPVGGFLTLGCLIALMQYLLRKSEEKKKGGEDQ